MYVHSRRDTVAVASEGGVQRRCTRRRLRYTCIIGTFHERHRRGHGQRSIRVNNYRQSIWSRGDRRSSSGAHARRSIGPLRGWPMSDPKLGQSARWHVVRPEARQETTLRRPRRGQAAAAGLVERLR
ncbi:unnamed protein product [Trichogramma brassicae]|uniref:Uncharacterized protein n=1 Tax=Trichogramma brassicae TaxID=86971 RepID=A0A6H5J2K2_9HYME|nr:unnamed protein product [Trichogramma brassicae]